jgi:hypothetical protein
VHASNFAKLDPRLQKRYSRLVKEMTHSVNQALSGLSILATTAQPMSAVRAMSRFLNNETITFQALIEPAQQVIREAANQSLSEYALVVHDWCMFTLQHESKLDRLQDGTYIGYELASALVVDAHDGRTLGPMELRLRNANGILSTRTSSITPSNNTEDGHVNDLPDAMTAATAWNIDKKLIHVIDREADSIWHYREWMRVGHQFLVRADAPRYARWHNQEMKLSQIGCQKSLQFMDVLTSDGQQFLINTKDGLGRVQVAETMVILDRPAKKTIPNQKTARGHKKTQKIPGVPIEMRLVMSRVISETGEVFTEWYLLTNLKDSSVTATEIATWYAWRWRIESYHKLLKSAGMNGEDWQQESGEAFLRRMCIASMSCLTVWHLQRDPSEEAKRLRVILVRLSGRLMKHKVESTAPALLAGLEKLLAIVNFLEQEDIEEVLSLARKVIPRLFKDD